MINKNSSERSVSTEFKNEPGVPVERITERQRQIKRGNCGPLSLKEAADYLGVSDSGLYKLCAAGEISFHKPKGRLFFYQDELDDWVKGKSTNKKGGTIESNK